MFKNRQKCDLQVFSYAEEENLDSYMNKSDVHHGLYARVV